MTDISVRQYPPRVLEAFVGNLCVAAVQSLNPRHSFQMLQPGIGDLYFAEPQRSEVGQPLQVPQTSIRDLGLVEVMGCFPANPR